MSEFNICHCTLSGEVHFFKEGEQACEICDEVKPFDLETAKAYIEGMQKELLKLKSTTTQLQQAVHSAARWFREYEKMHREKGAIEKAARNKIRAELLESVCQLTGGYPQAMTTPTSDVERVARALAVKHGIDPDAPYAWDDSGPCQWYWQLYTNDAATAIAAIALQAQAADDNVRYLRGKCPVCGLTGKN